MKIVSLTPELISAASKLCRQSMELDIMPDFLLKEKTFDDPDFDPELNLLVFKNGNKMPVGFISGVQRKNDDKRINYIKLLCVEPNFRRKGIAQKLYSILEEKFRKKGSSVTRVYESTPNYFMPGIDPRYTEALCFFEKNGFRRFGDTANLIVALNNDFDFLQEVEKLKKENIICRRAELKDQKEVFGFLTKHFLPWLGEVKISFSNNPLSLFLAFENNELIGFSAYDTNNKGIGWFGPMGTNEKARGKGAGSVLYKMCLDDMKKIGYTKAIIPWIGPICFYMKNSEAKVQRVFWRYKKIFE